MKKLIAMIGAVAMSFCAFADEPAATPGISFEGGEAGVLDGTFTPSAGTGTWTWAPGDPLELGAYATGELTAAGVYGTGDKVRREELFPKGGDNGNYLKLDTGTAELTRGMDADAGTGCIDQLVKFTGFEEPQTNLTAGIGVWMSEFVTNDVDDAATTDLTETNLYVTVGQVVSGQNNKIALKIDGDYKLDTWYRLTIKPIGDIFTSGSGADESRAGFVIYINGNPVASSDPRAYRLSEDDPANPQYLKGEAAKLMLAGQLFTAVVAGEANHSIVGYKGVGSIDDIILTNALPKFAITTVDVTFAPITGAIITKVVDSDGNEFNNPTGAIAVKPGDLTVTLAPVPGYKIIKGDGTYIVKTDDAVGGQITIPAAKDFEEAVAYVVNAATPAETNYYLTAELLTMVNGLVDGDTAMFTAEATIMDEEEVNQLYGFTEGTTIGVQVASEVTNWVVAVAGSESWPIDNVGAEEKFIKVYTFEDDASTLLLGGNVAGAITAPKIEATAAITVSGVLKAAALSIDSTITLSGAGKVMCENKLVYSGDGKVFTNEDIEEIAPVAPDTYYTYQIKAAPGTFTVTVPTLTTGLLISSITTNGTEVVDPVAGTYTLNVGETFSMTYAADAANGYEFTEQGETGVRNATTTTTIEPPTVALKTFTVTFADGTNSTIDPPAGESNLVWGTVIEVTATPAEDYEYAADSYEGWEKTSSTKLTTNVTVTADATFTAPNATAIPYAAQVAANGGEATKFRTAAEALAAVQDLEKDSANFPIIATALVDDLEIDGPAGQQIVLSKNETVTINANSWVFSSGVTITPGTPIALAAGATFTVVGQLTKESFTAPTGYLVVEIAGAGTYTYAAYKTVEVPTAKTGLTYNGAEQTGVEEAEGFKLADNKKTAADDYKATATLDEGYVWSDGKLDPATIDWSIAKAALTVTGLDVPDKVYDGTTTATIQGPATLQGAVVGDDVALENVPTSGTYASKDAADGIAVTFTPMTLTGTAAGNYVLTQPTLTGDIEKSSVTVTAENKEINEGDDAPTFTATVSQGVASGETLEYTLACEYTKGDTAGDYPITVEVTTPSDVNKNYNITPVAGTLTVKAAAIPEPEDLPAADKEAYAAWYNSHPAPAGDTALTEKEDLKDAYLLDCDAGEKALADAKKEFKFASITCVNGVWTATIDKSTGDAHQFYGNGEITMTRYSDVGCKTMSETGNFFKATLGYKK